VGRNWLIDGAGANGWDRHWYGVVYNSEGGVMH